MKDHSVKLAILQVLSKGTFCSGEELGKELGISRAAISKHIKGVQDWGIDIFRVQGKGYQLAKPIELLDKDIIQNQVENHIVLMPVIDSTNQYLLDRADMLESGTVCIAEYQSNGRGRRGREWISPFGSNLYLSLYWRLDAGMAAAIGLSLVVGIAIVEALEKLGLPNIKLKWPNDLYFGDKKLAGILVEMSGQAGAAANLVIGMGLNIHMQKNTEGISQPWSCLESVANGAPIDRNALATKMISTLNDTLKRYEQAGMAQFVDKWNKLDNFINRPVKLIIGAKEISGISRGIDEQGAIVIETQQGLETYIGGEISLRPVQ